MKCVPISIACSFDFKSKMAKPPTSSFVSAKGPSMTDVFPPDTRMRAPCELGRRPPELTVNPALLASSPRFSTAAINVGFGGLPASESFVAFTIIMNRTVLSLNKFGREIVNGSSLPLGLSLGRVATRSRLLRRNISAGRIDETASAILVVVAYPVPHREVRPGLVAALRRDVEIHVRAEHFLVPAAVTGVGMEDVAVRVFVEDAHARELLDQCVGHAIVVENLARRKFFRRERNVIIEIEVALVRRHPVEAPAHAFLESFQQRQRRARHSDEGHVVLRQVLIGTVDMVGKERAAHAAFP